METLRTQGEIAGRPYADLNRIWTIEELQSVARQMGKPFNPADEIKDRLATDLTEGALVLLNENEVIVAIERGLVPGSMRERLIERVTLLNDISIIPSGAVARWEEEQRRLSVLSQDLGF